MKTKTKALIALSFGGICVALALIYGVSGQMLTSISERGAHIARWEKELVKEGQELEAFIADTEKLGKKTDATPAEREQFEHSVDRVERMGENLKSTRERIEHERSRRKEQLLITAGLAGLGVLSMLIGALLLRRRAPRVGSL